MESNLPRTRGKRFLLIVLGIPLGLMALSGLLNFDGWLGPARDWQGLLLKVVLGEVFAALLVLSLLSVVWAIAMPSWVEQGINHTMLILSLAIFGFFPLMFLMIHAIRG